jgi:hypothetical protein
VYTANQTTREPVTRRAIGLDLGKAVDFTALTVLEWTWPPSPLPALAPPSPPSPITAPALTAGSQRPAPGKPTYNVTALKRWPLGTSYVTISEWFVRLFQSPDLAGLKNPPPVLVVDETGVGAAVVQMLYAELSKARVSGEMLGVTITAGSAVSLAGIGRWRVAKKQLASVLVTLFQGKRLNIAPLADRDLLIREAQAFSVKVTPAGNETFESWRENDHDDMVLSLALACWAAENIRFPAWPPPDRGPILAPPPDRR